MAHWNSKGQAIALGPEIGRGGEGRIHEVVGQPGLVAKLYHQAPKADDCAKLEVLAQLRDDHLQRIAAWPVDVLRDARGAGIGFLMPRAAAGFLPVHELYNPRSRLRLFPAASWAFMVHVSYNTARAFAEMHQRGVVLGDVNHSNLLVNKQGHVFFIDCDSVQVRGGGKLYRCRVGVPEYTPPELQGQDLRTVDRTEQHDAFGLAVLVFHLLMLGRHPYVGRHPGIASGDPSDFIRNSVFAYGAAAQRRGVSPPPLVPGLDLVGPALGNLFEEAFAPVGTFRPRPRAEQWISAIEQLKGSMTRCASETGHFYAVGASACTWCALEGRLGPLWPTPAQVSTSNLALSMWEQARKLFEDPRLPFRPRPVVDVEVLWLAILSVTAPSAQDLELPLVLDPDPSPPLALLALRARRHRALIICAQVVMTALLGLALVWPMARAEFCLAAVVGPLAFWMLTWVLKPHPTPTMQEREALLARERDVLAAAEVDDQKAIVRLEAAMKARTFYGQAQHLALQRDQLKVLLSSWDEPGQRVSLPRSLHTAWQQIQDLHAQHERLPAKRQEGWVKLQAGAREGRLKRHLQAAPLPGPGHIAGIGAGRLITLQSYGISCAADVTEDRLYVVPGFGPALIARMVAWRGGVERRFQFQPGSGPDPQDIADLDRLIGRERTSLESQILSGSQSLLASIRRLTEEAADARVNQATALIAALQGGPGALRSICDALAQEREQASEAANETVTRLAQARANLKALGGGGRTSP